MRIRIIDEYTDELEDVARRSRTSTFYHTRPWVESLAAVFPRMAFACIVAESNGVTAGFLPFFYVKRGPFRAAMSLPLATYGGPAALDEHTETALVHAYADVAASPSVVEAVWEDFHGVGNADGWDAKRCETHLIRLDGGFDALWNGAVSSQRKKRARQAQRHGVAVRDTRSVGDVKCYYDIYSNRVDAWGRRYRHPAVLFERLLDSGGQTVRLFVAEYKGSIVGGHFNFYFKDTVTAWNGVTTIESNKIQAATALYVHCLKEACGEGYRVYNLGSSLNKRSLIEFKESLGGVSYSYSQYKRRSLLGKIASLAKRAGG